MNSEFGIRNSEFPPVPQRAEAAARKFEIRNSKFEIAFLVLGLSLAFVGCAHRGAKGPKVVPVAPAPTPAATGTTEKGLASWYGEPYHGRSTASGEVYDMHQLTAAHRSLPFGTLVNVRRRDTGADVEVRINDRGPFIEGRIIDLSYRAAKVIGLDVDGVAPVTIRVIGITPSAPAAAPPPAAAGTMCFWVQVGAFAERDNAVRSERSLEKAGEQAVILEGADGFWRVRLGPFDDKETAERARNRLTDSWPGAHLVQCGG